MKNCFFAVLFFVFSAQAFGQAGENDIERPKVVVGIVVDQMRQEYLYRYYSKFGEGGFKRLMNVGFMIRNGHYNYAPTLTGPGHASIYTGTTPAVHGIISNDWYDKRLQKHVNCVNDPDQKAVGEAGSSGTVSPWRLLTTTLTDELKLFTQNQSKVVAVAIKDRGAVLAAGHMADGAYWYDSKTGNFITSTYYKKQLPDWVQKFNTKKLPAEYLGQEWRTLLPIVQYTESGPDDSPYENKIGGKEKSIFPYNLKTLRNSDNHELLVYTPFANDYLTEMAKAALDGEKMGHDAVTDFLAVSYSSADYLGHAVGPNAVELEDMYLRLDRNIEDLMKTLDAKIGNGKYTVFLTSDHGVADVAQYMRDNRLPAGYFNIANVKANLNDFLKQYFPDKEMIETIDGDRIFLNHQAFKNDPKSSGVEMLIATELITNFLMQQEGIANVYPESTLRQGRFDEEGLKGMIIRGYHPKRSGDLIIVLESGWYGAGRIQGTTHGSPYTYDTHVPILFFGSGVKKGSSVKYYSITDIAPTISMLLNIKIPSGCTGQPIDELFEK